MISQWAAAHAANDVGAEISFYASMVNPYYDRHNVPRELILQARQDLLSKGVILSRYEASNVTVTMNGDEDATVNLEKIWSTRMGDLMPHHTRSQLHVRSIDGKWLIASERDF
jgi:ketosteroid isomerase-like protein